MVDYAEESSRVTQYDWGAGRKNCRHRKAGRAIDTLCLEGGLLINSRGKNEYTAREEFLPASPSPAREMKNPSARALITLREREAAKIKARHVKGAEKLPSSLSLWLALGNVSLEK